MTYREFLGELIAQNGIYHWLSGNHARGIKYLTIAAKLNPQGAEIHDILGKMYMILADSKGAPEQQLDLRVKGAEELSKAGRLGIVRLDNSNYAMEMKKKQGSVQGMKTAGGGHK